MCQNQPPSGVETTLIAPSGLSGCRWAPRQYDQTATLRNAGCCLRMPNRRLASRP
ncbi:Uncharacterised protein [Mycobacteroides abscessus subsp. abscessus]|nr:Uncharacterised protein [Mycobacteroides abscessus subsp. abscessus]